MQGVSCNDVSPPTSCLQLDIMNSFSSVYSSRTVVEIAYFSGLWLIVQLIITLTEAVQYDGQFESTSKTFSLLSYSTVKKTFLLYWKIIASFVHESILDFISFIWDVISTCLMEFGIGSKTGISYKCRYYQKNDIHQRLLNSYIQKKVNWEIRNSSLSIPETASADCGVLLLGTVVIWYAFRKKIAYFRNKDLRLRRMKKSTIKFKTLSTYKIWILSVISSYERIRCLITDLCGNYYSYLLRKLLLAGDVELNPGPYTPNILSNLVKDLTGIEHDYYEFGVHLKIDSDLIKKFKSDTCNDCGRILIHILEHFLHNTPEEKWYNTICESLELIGRNDLSISIRKKYLHETLQVHSTSSRLTNEDYLRYVREHDDDITDSLSKVNLEQFTRKLSQKANISYSVFNSFDIDNTDSKLLIRYMLRSFCEKLKSGSTTWNDLLLVISSLDGDTSELTKILKTIEIQKSKGFALSHGTSVMDSVDLSDSRRDPVVTYISRTVIKVTEGMSTLLFVQASPKESVSYQWKKNGTVLEEDCNFSGVNCDMLVITKASMDVEGEYTCCVRNYMKEVQSESIVLSVIHILGKKKLLDLYSTKQEVSRDSWPPKVCKDFINLALITSPEDSKFCSDITVRGNVDDILAQKETVKYDDVFKQCKSRELTMIEGRPGSGKTTLVHKIIKDWVSGKTLVGAKLVFLVVLRELNNAKTKTLQDLLQGFYFDDRELQAVRQNILDSNGENVVFVFDGLDEYNYLNNKSCIIFQLLNKKVLPLSMIVVSSRPSASKSLSQEIVSNRIEIVGFNENEIMEYIENFPFSTTSSSTSVQDTLKKYLHAHPNVMDMCYLPVHTAMICYLHDKKSLNSLSTLTDIYEQFTLSMILRHMQKIKPGVELKSLQGLNEGLQNRFNSICKLAYCMTVNSNQIVTLEDIKAHLGRDIILQESDCLGLVTIYNQVKSTGTIKMFTFLHLTLQEFLAAYYISRLSSSNQLKIYKKYSECEHMEKMWSFYCGLVEFQPNMKQFNEVFVKSKNQMRAEASRKKVVQYAFEAQKQEVCDRVTKTLDGKFDFIHSILTPSDLVAIGYVICNTTVPVTEIWIGEQHYSDNRINILLKKMCKKHFDKLQRLYICSQISTDGIDFLIRILKSCRCLKSIQASLINFSIEQGEQFADSINFYHHSIRLSLSSSPSSIEALIQKLSNLPSFVMLWLTFEDISRKGVEALARSLTVCSHTNLHTLAFVNTSVRHKENCQDSCSEPVKNDHKSFGTDQSVCTIGCEGAAYLSSSFQYLSALQRLDLSHNNIGNEGVVSLSGSFQYLTELRKLDLSHNNIGYEGAVNLSGSFQYLTDLSELFLSHNNIGSEGASGLVGSFQYLTKLWRLDLSHNDIGNVGALSLSSSFQYLTGLERLHLSHNKLGSQGAVSLSGSFQYLTELWELDLSHNNIGSEGAAGLSVSFQYLTELLKLDLSHNNIGLEGIRSLANEISHLTSLWRFYIAHNNIDLEGALLFLTNLKELHDLSDAVINTNEQDYELSGIVVQDIVTSDNSTAIEKLKAAAQNKEVERKLNLGFTSINIPPPAKKKLFKIF